MSSQTDLTHEDVKKILELVDQSDSVELLLEYGEFKLHVRKGCAGHGNSGLLQSRAGISADKSGALSPPADAVASSITEASAEVGGTTGQSARNNAAPAALPEGAVPIRAPMLGRFYRASSPSEPPFVEVGSKVSVDDTVGIIEVMKLFNEVKSSVSGTVIEVCTANEGMVEEGDLLLAIQPD